VGVVEQAHKAVMQTQQPHQEQLVVEELVFKTQLTEHQHITLVAVVVVDIPHKTQLLVQVLLQQVVALQE
jgi:hypothetical protein